MINKEAGITKKFNMQLGIIIEHINKLKSMFTASEAIRKELLVALKRIADIEDERYTHGGFDLEVNTISKAAIKANKQGKSGRREARK